jgi:hypothetical protein
MGIQVRAMWLTRVRQRPAYSQRMDMELALTLASIASFFALIVAWTILPASKELPKSAPAAAVTPQAAH